MARLRPLFHYARLSDRRAWTVKRSGVEKLLEYGVGIVLVYALLQQLRTIAMSPLPMSLLAARQMLLAIAVAWVLLPSTASTSIPVRRFAQYPLTGFQRAAYRVATLCLSWRIAAVFGVSLLSVLAFIRAPHPAVSIAEAAGLLMIAACAGLASAIVFPKLQSGVLSSRRSGAAGASRSYPLLRKELRCYARTLDLYLALAVSIAAGLTEHLGTWMTPAKATVPILLLAFLQLPAVLNPFGLESSAELDRYRLLPVPFWKLLLNKHIALALLLSLSAAPIAAALVYRMPWADSCMTALQFFLVLLSWLATGSLLMGTRAARQILMAYGTVSGNGMSMLLAATAACLVAAVPVGGAVVMRTITMRKMGPVAEDSTALVLLSLLTVVYVLILRKQDWPAGEL